MVIGNRKATGLVVGLALALAAPALAEEAAPEASQTAVEESDQGEAAPEEEEGGSRFSGIIQADFTNAYFFRGILNERDGFIVQPWAELYASLYSAEEGPIRDLSVGFGVWNSVQSEETGAEKNPQDLYETDYYPILSVEFPYDVSITGYYYWYTSPNDAFSTTQELNFRVEWDDSEVLERFALAPWVNVAVETHGTALGDDKGVGVQFGIAPTLYSYESERFDVSFTFPIEVGLSAKDYYEDDEGDQNTFGYVNFGVAADIPLKFVPKGFGSWYLGLSAKGFYFSDVLKEVNEGDRWYPLLMASPRVEF